jgi:hypothetical protein
MGSAASTNKQRICPSGYEEDKFKMILKLYDKLDNDGDNVIDIKELKSIADLHIKNNITQNRNELKQNEKYKTTNINLLEVECEKKKSRMLAEIEAEFESKRRDFNNHFEDKQRKLEENIRLYGTMDCGTKSDAFMSVISDDNNIDFWEFFEYMKKRTGDIKNIDFS